MARAAISTAVLRVVQVIFEITSFGSLVQFMTGSGWLVSFSQALLVSACWASVAPLIFAILSLLFCWRQRERWSLSLTFDALAVTSAAAAIGCIVGNDNLGFDGWYVQQKIALAAMSAALLAHVTTLTQTIIAYRRHLKKTNPSDPLMPYLMKKEIDVWCYPVQNEQGQLFVDYEPVSGTAASKPSSAAQSMRSRSVKSFVRVDDEPQQAPASRPESSVETTAGWSVPSQNETLPRSLLAPSTALPSYRSPSRPT